MTSREELAMDFNKQDQDSITFGKKSGCFMSRFLSAVLLVLFLSCLLATGLLVHYFTPGCPGPEDVLGGGSGSGEAAVDTAPEHGAGPSSKKPRDVRLPLHLIPSGYNVRLLPFIEEGNFTFNGEVTVTMSAEAAGSNITLHINDLVVDHGSVVVRDVTTNSDVTVTDIKYDKDREFFIVMLSKSVVVGREYTVYARFVGKMEDKLAGLYLSSYKDAQGHQRYMAVTQFQPTDARQAFLCMDEPALKATFEVALGRPKGWSSASNMPIRSTEPIDGVAGFEWDLYQKSVPMSTYLVAFMVSELAVKEADPGISDTLFRVWARPAAIQQAEYARGIGPRILKFFEDYFQTPYPLPKQDMAALPDFAAGAMENWGLITYRETAMLYDPAVSSAHNKQRVAVVVSHELAHQWFGNLVTPSWWTDLWLNEGFASYVEYLGVDHVEPEWRMMEQIVTNDLQRVMGTDALESSHPISIVVGHPDEINEIFDRISYEKGASIIRMMSHYLTSNTLRAGLANYLNDRKYQGATQDDLWRALTAQAHVDGTLATDVTVKQIMDTWTLQMGYPVVDVERDYTGGTARLTQSRFLLNGGQSPADYLWWVPITHTSQRDRNFNNTQPSSWMRNQRQVTLRDMPPADQWVLFNVQEVGYFKVNYDEKNWQMLINQLNVDHTAIHVVNRAQLIDDALDLATSGRLGYDTALSVIGYLDAEREYLPWDAAFDNLAYVNTQLKRTAGYGPFKKFILKLIGPLYERVGFEESPDDSHLQRFSRVNLLNWACAVGHPDCVQRSVQKFKQWMASPDDDSIIPANLKSRVYCTAIAEGGEDEWEFAWARYKAANVAAERSRLLSAMACTKQIWMLSRYLNWTVTPDSGIRVQDGAHVFASISGNSVGRYLAWDFLRNNIKLVLKIYSSGSFQLKYFIKTLKRGYNTELDLAQLRQFYGENSGRLAQAQREMEQAIEHSATNLAWMNRNYHTIVSWLQRHG